MSTHIAEVIRIPKLEEHPNADSLSLVQIGGFTVVVRTDDWKEGDLAVYIEPDMVVDSDLPQFTFLKGHERIKTRKFRGIYSQGLLVPAPEGAVEGENVIEQLNITRYEPKGLLQDGRRRGASVEAAPSPPGIYPKYDVENMRRYDRIIEPGEPVVITEKLHGANACFVWVDGKLHCKSRKEFKTEGSTWHQAAEQNQWIEAWCKEHPGSALYGEIFGWIQDLKYGASPGEIYFRAFDVCHQGAWLDWHMMKSLLEPDLIAPIVKENVPWDPSMMELAEGNTLIPNVKQMREGIVIKPVVERWDRKVGRVQLKVVSNKYLAKAK